jgi:methylisocitrate lyase
VNARASLLEAGSTVAAPGALEPFTAALIERLGFGAVYLGGNAIGAHLGVGQPFATQTETLELATRIARTVSVPVVLDVGAGFGEPAHVRRTVRECKRTGVAAIHLDDQPYPKRAGYHRGRALLAPTGQVVDRLRAAVEERGEDDLVVIARTDALRVTASHEATAERCHAYAEAGVDALLVLDLEPAGLAELAPRLPDLPLVWIGATSGPSPTLAALEAAGFRLALFPFNTLAAITEAMGKTWRPLAAGGSVEQSPQLLAEAKQTVNELVGLPAYWEVEEATVERAGGPWRPAGSEQAEGRS